MHICLLILACLSNALAQRPPDVQRGRPGKAEAAAPRAPSIENAVYAERVSWLNPGPKDDTADPSKNLVWPIGSTQTLQWKSLCPKTFVVEIFAEGTKIGDGGQNLLRNRLREGNDVQTLEWKVSLDGHHLSASGIYYLMVWVDDEHGKGHQGYSHHINITQGDSEGHGAPLSVVSTEVKTLTPQAGPAPAPKDAFTTETSTVASARESPSSIVLMTISSRPPVSVTTMAASQKSNSFFELLPVGPMVTRTDTFTLSFVPTLDVGMVTGTPSSVNHGGLPRKNTPFIGIAVAGTVVGLASVVVGAFFLWRRLTGIRMARLEPGHHVVGPNEFVLMKGNEWAIPDHSRTASWGAGYIVADD